MYGLHSNNFHYTLHCQLRAYHVSLHETGLATSLTVPSVRISTGQQIFLFSKTFSWDQAYPVSHSMVTGLKRPWRDADHTSSYRRVWVQLYRYRSMRLMVYWVITLSCRICKVSSAPNTEPSWSQEMRAMWNVPKSAFCTALTHEVGQYIASLYDMPLHVTEMCERRMEQSVQACNYHFSYHHHQTNPLLIHPLYHFCVQ
jgi:hypothetical protein